MHARLPSAPPKLPMPCLSQPETFVMTKTGKAPLSFWTGDLDIKIAHPDHPDHIRWLEAPQNRRASDPQIYSRTGLQTQILIDKKEDALWNRLRRNCQTRWREEVERSERYKNKYAQERKAFRALKSDRDFLLH